jgi:prevent-host-death family protein
MKSQSPKTQTMKISDVRSQLNTLVNRVYRNETRVLVEKSGIPVAALVSIEDLELLSGIAAKDREAWEILEAMRRPFRDVPPEEIEREALRAADEAKASLRAERETIRAAS